MSDQAKLNAALAEIAVLREALKQVLASAVPNKRDHPTMSAAWPVGEAVLAQPNAEAELVARKARALDKLERVVLSAPGFQTNIHLNGPYKTLLEAIEAAQGGGK